MADLSPELAARIQSLEAKYAANPARFYVALASEWREGGDIARAEQILRENIRNFPGLSAHMLLGRCLADRGAFQEANNEFRYVLSIDSQNQVALRMLADMSAAGGRRAEAEKWYRELLAVDPMNVEAAAALAQLARAAAAEPDAAAPSAPDADDDEFGMIDLGAPDASPADASGVAADDDLGEWGDLTLDAPAEAEAQPAAAGDAREFDAFGFGSVRLTEEESPAGDAGGSAEWMDTGARLDVGESAADGDDALPLLDDTLIDAPLAGADLPLLDAEPVDDDNDLVTTVSQPGAGFGFGEPPGGFDDGGPAAHEDGHDVDAEMVTETMAELYASQGLHAQAADVYRELIGQRGEEPGLVRRLAEIEAQIQPAAWAEPASTEPGAEAETPDWLESVDAFARGAPETPMADAGLQGGLPELDLSPDLVDEERAAATGLDAEPSAAADELGLIEPEYASIGSGPSAGASIDDFAAVEPAPVDDFASIVASAAAEAGFDAGESAPAPGFEPAAASASADPFADSFAAGFDGAAVEPAGVGADDGRQPWQAPSVAETAPVGFDILVMEDGDGAEVPASSEVVADMSADWAIAAAPLGDDEEEAELAAAAPGSTAPAQEPAFADAPGRTMAGYFASLLAWRPGPPAAAPTYEVSAEGGAITIEPAAPEAPAFESAAEPEASAAYEPQPPPFLDAAPGIPTFEAPAFQPPPAPPFGAAEPEAPAPGDAEPWAAAAEDEPWAAAPETPAGEAGPADAGDLPLLDLEEPWAGSPAAPRAEPVDLGAFTLAEDAAPAPAGEDAGAEELLPWEVPAEPAAAAPEAPAAGGSGFSFEDFFAGAPAGSAPAAPAESAPAESALTESALTESAPSESPPAAEPEPEMEMAAPPVEPAAPAFIPSFAEPTPPPVFEAPAPVAPPASPPAAPAAPAAEAEGEEDEDLESFQAWLQSLKR